MQNRLEYDHALKHYRDTLNGLRGAKEEGRAKGIAKGRAKAIRENACKMKHKGIADDVIADVTGLSIEEIQQL
jgi:predicted transposase/invertase (TIGR01784 family)